MLAHGSNENVASLVVGRNLLVFIRKQHGLALGAHHDLVLRDFKVIHMNSLAIVTSSRKGSLVDHVCEISTGETRGATRENVQVDILGHGNLLGVNLQDLFTATNVRAVNDDATIKAAWPEKSRIKNIRTICGGNKNDAIVRFKAIHLNQKLVERLLTLIVAAAKASAAMPTNSIDLVDKDDARGILLALFEEVTHTRCANADKHFNKV